MTWVSIKYGTVYQLNLFDLTPLWPFIDKRTEPIRHQALLLCHCQLFAITGVLLTWPTTEAGKDAVVASAREGAHRLHRRSHVVQRTW